MIDLLDDIIQCEVDFARDFSNAIDRPWGVLYHNVEIPDSHDSNHACVTDPGADLRAAICEVVAFYHNRQLTPRVYHLGTDRSDALRSALAAAGFAFRDHNSIFVACRRASAIRSVDGISVRRVTQMTPPLCEMIERSDGIRERKVVERKIRQSTYHLFVGFLQDQPCSMAGLQIVGNLTRVDDVLTDISHRGHGYSRAVIDHAVRYHADCIGNTLYLFTDNPAAERIYRKAGFVDIDAPLCSWSAALEPAAC